MFLSPHFTLEELVRSQTASRLGIDNTPPDYAIENLRQLCNNTLERIRGYIANGKGVHVDSGYRCLELNRALGSSSDNSQHIQGEAADIVIKGMTPRLVVESILIHGAIPFDQLICEFDQWVHVSYSTTKQRRQVLEAYRGPDGRAVYIPFK